MNIRIEHRAPIYNGYRATCVRSLYNVDDPTFTLDATLPLENEPWCMGLVVGPSGSGKSSMGARIFAGDDTYAPPPWPKDQPVVEAVSPDADWNSVTAAFTSVGLGSVPAWLRPYHLLSTGEKFRAELARVICDAPARVVIDEFTSVVDRQIARIGALAFAKAWRRICKNTGGQAVLLSCHYDIVDWLAPDWIFDTGTGEFTWTRGRLRRPDITLEIRQTGWEWWPHFEPHHYLKLPHMIAATCYVGFVDGEPVAHLGVSTRVGMVEARACRLVVMPEWQGAGVGLRFLNAVCDMWRRGKNRYEKPMPTLFHTSHPGLAAALRRSPLWTQVSARLYGESKASCAESIARSRERRGVVEKLGVSTGFGGHFRAVQGFRYLGESQEGMTCES